MNEFNNNTILIRSQIRFKTGNEYLYSNSFEIINTNASIKYFVGYELYDRIIDLIILKIGMNKFSWHRRWLLGLVNVDKHKLGLNRNN